MLPSASYAPAQAILIWKVGENQRKQTFESEERILGYLHLRTDVRAKELIQEFCLLDVDYVLHIM